MQSIPDRTSIERMRLSDRFDFRSEALISASAIHLAILTEEAGLRSCCYLIVVVVLQLLLQLLLNLWNRNFFDA
jgi:hypothetical protein